MTRRVTGSTCCRSVQFSSYATSLPRLTQIAGACHIAMASRSPRTEPIVGYTMRCGHFSHRHHSTIACYLLQNYCSRWFAFGVAAGRNLAHHCRPGKLPSRKVADSKKSCYTLRTLPRPISLLLRVPIITFLFSSIRRQRVRGVDGSCAKHLTVDC